MEIRRWHLILVPLLVWAVVWLLRRLWRTNVATPS